MFVQISEYIQEYGLLTFAVLEEVFRITRLGGATFLQDQLSVTRRFIAMQMFLAYGNANEFCLLGETNLCKSDSHLNGF